MTNETITKAQAMKDVLDVFNSRKAAIEARSIPQRTAVLRWDNGLFIGWNDEKLDAFATGFEHARFFGDMEAARAFQRRYRVKNGKGEEPGAVLAFNARQGALVELDRCIANISEF